MKMKLMIQFLKSFFASKIIFDWETQEKSIKIFLKMALEVKRL